MENEIKLNYDIKGDIAYSNRDYLFCPRCLSSGEIAKIHDFMSYD
jgi:hypothetical protein